ncbi:sporulation protein [Bacillus sp. 165]|uniref:sporulation protein n=1 Tax=Bacillus sp. 165 TaxID=1529117 RepID=UPI001AD9D847|nr:sporulation protein [Bacillus sp. 165]MBO9129296.1 sporulation protein [Bacillus sp. 165]
MFKKMLASVGIGGAKVDTILERDQYTAGEKVQGLVNITGGNIEQQIDSIYLRLSTTYTREADDKKVTASYTLDQFQITDPIHIQPGEKKEVPFSFVLPIDTPITFGMKKVWIDTGLDIKNSIDPGDTDYIQVLPSTLVASILDNIQQMGFRLRQVECEEVSRRYRNRYPFAQQLEFIPVSGPYYRKLDELEFLLFPVSETSVDLVIEIDRKARGLAGLFSEALDMDETIVRMTVTSQNAASFASDLQTLLTKYS